MNQTAQTFWLENLKLADRYNNWIFEQIKPHLGNNVLEVGCGNGNFTLFLAQQCDRVTGIDINSNYVELAKKIFNVSTEVFVDKKRLRPSEVPLLIGRNDKIINDKKEKKEIQ